MKQIRKIIELHLSGAPLSIRTISSATGVSRPVIKEYLTRLSINPLRFEQVSKMSDYELQSALGLETSDVIETPENLLLMAWLHLHINELHNVGMTRRLLHERYREQYPEGLQYSQFCFVLQQKHKSHESSSLLEHKAGDRFYVDFTGHKLHWIDMAGQKYTEEIFLGVMGASGYLYSTPVFTQRQEDLSWAVQQAMKNLGGVPKVIVPDCLKSAVIKHDGYEPEINTLFQRVCSYYGLICIPARPKHPRDKSLVEGSVNLVYRQILSRVQDKAFEDRGAMLVWWQSEVDKINAANFQKIPGSRLSRFQTIDKPALAPLPQSEYPLIGVNHQTVAPTGAVYLPLDKTYYSVPYSLQDKKVEILTYPEYLEVWYENQLYATHQRKPLAGQVIQSEHRPPAHRWYAERSTQELLRSMIPVGLHVASWAQKVALACEHEDQSWLILTGLQKLISKMPERIDTACRLALRTEDVSLKKLRNILKSGEDLTVTADEEKNLELPVHENVRGGNYYLITEVGA
ncbi:MAG: IS21 family transposase [Desulfocucumaceae bacterium]